MSGSSFGSIFRVTTFGESHGTALGAVVDGCPPGVRLGREMVQHDLDRRRPGQSSITTARAEGDRVEILSGMFKGKTTGTPIALLIMNHDHDPSAYDKIKDKFRPGHADLTYLLKYGFRDHRGGGRASGRETAGRVAAGAVARAVLDGFGVTVQGATIQVGKIRAAERNLKEIEKNSLRCPDARAAKKMLAMVEAVKREGDSVGGVIEVIAQGVPAGLGEPVFAKLDALIASALMSIGAVKGVEIGDGFAAAQRKGSENSDPLELGRDGKVRSCYNRGGGILGGISTGEPIIARLAVKPTSSIAREQDSIDLKGRNTKLSVQGRHDPCLCPRIVPVAEAMMLLVICDQLFIQRAKTGKPGPAGRVGKK